MYRVCRASALPRRRYLARTAACSMNGSSRLSRNSRKDVSSVLAAQAAIDAITQNSIVEEMAASWTGISRMRNAEEAGGVAKMTMCAHQRIRKTYRWQKHLGRWRL